MLSSKSEFKLGFDKMVNGTRGRHIALFQLASVVVIAVVAFSSIHLLRGPSQGHNPAALEAAFKYITDLPPTATVLMFNDNQPTTAFTGDPKPMESSRKYLKDVRPGRYRRAWGSAQIDMIILPGINTLPDAAKISEISRLGLRNDIAVGHNKLRQREGSVLLGDIICMGGRGEALSSSILKMLTRTRRGAEIAS